MWRRRIVAIFFGAIALVFILAGPAFAKFTVNTAGCKGTATITGTDGKTYIVNAAAAKATVPREGTVAWQGSTSKAVKNHHGSIALKIGPFKFNIDSWGNPNKNGDLSKSGTRDMPSAFKNIPPGKYVITGGHSGKGGKCTGSIVITVEGSVFSTPAGLVALGGTVVFGALALFSGLAKARH